MAKLKPQIETSFRVLFAVLLLIWGAFLISTADLVKHISLTGKSFFEVVYQNSEPGLSIIPSFFDSLFAFFQAWIFVLIGGVICVLITNRSKLRNWLLSILAASFVLQLFFNVHVLNLVLNLSLFSALIIYAAIKGSWTATKNSFKYFFLEDEDPSKKS